MWFVCMLYTLNVSPSCESSVLTMTGNDLACFFILLFYFVLFYFELIMVRKEGSDFFFQSVFPLIFKPS